MIRGHFQTSKIQLVFTFEKPLHSMYDAFFGLFDACIYENMMRTYVVALTQRLMDSFHVTISLRISRRPLRLLIILMLIKLFKLRSQV